MTIKFPDLSHYVPGVPLTGVVALITKATQGTDYVDPTYAGYRDKALALGIPFAAYHYVTTDSPTEQAKHALAVIGRSIPAMWDVEANSGNITHLLAVHDAYTALGGRATLAYVPQWYWGQIGRPDLRPLSARGLALISSAYTTYSDSGIGWKPYGGVTPDIWQYTSSGPLNGHKVDMNAFRGTVAELRKLFDGGTSAADVGVDMTEVDLTPAAQAALVAAILAAKCDAVPVAEQGIPGLTVRGALRQSAARTDRIANVDDPADVARDAALSAKLDALAAAVAANPGAGTGGSLDAAAVRQIFDEELAKGDRAAADTLNPPAAPGA